MIRRLIILLLIAGCVFGDVISVTGFKNNTSKKKNDCYSFDEDDSQFELSRFKNSDDCWNLLTNETQMRSDAGWVTSSIHTYTYDDNNYLIEKLSQIWNGSEWVTSSIHTNTYDENNNLIEAISMIDRDVKNTYIYDEKNNQIERVQFAWDGTNWVSHLIWTKTFDENNNLIESIIKKDYGSGWELDSRWELIYDENNNLIGTIRFSWDGSEWKLGHRHEFTYDENNNLIEEIGLSGSISYWFNVIKRVFSYDENNNLIEESWQHWQDSYWLNVTKRVFNYDENNNLIEESWQHWQDSYWVDNIRTTNYTYEVCNELSMDKELTLLRYNIHSIYPNPFNPTTIISFSIPKFGLTTITAYDIIGRKLETLTNEVLSIGNHSINWDASSYPSGVYLIRMDSGDFTQTQKVVLVK